MHFVLTGCATLLGYCQDSSCQLQQQSSSSPCCECTGIIHCQDMVCLSTTQHSVLLPVVKVRCSSAVNCTKAHTCVAHCCSCDIVQLVTKLRMINRDTGEIQYRLRGSIWRLTVDIDFWSEFELNLLTGRVLRHE